MAHRRAYYPRLWPMIVGGLMLVVPFAALVRPAWWVGALVGAVVGAATVLTRLWVWRRRHPEISTEEYLSDLYRSAPWN
jgi:hypothetical protein